MSHVKAAAKVCDCGGPNLWKQSDCCVAQLRVVVSGADASNNLLHQGQERGNKVGVCGYDRGRLQ